MLEDFVVGHVEDDEGVGEEAVSLHGQSLHARARVARQDKALLLLLDGLDLLAHHLGDDVVLDDGEVLEVGLDLLPQLLLLRHLLLQQVAHRNSGELVVVSHLQGEFSHFEPRRTDDEYLFGWVGRVVLWGVERRSMRKEMGSSGCLMMRCLRRSSKRS